MKSSFLSIFIIICESFVTVSLAMTYGKVRKPIFLFGAIGASVAVIMQALMLAGYR